MIRRTVWLTICCLLVLVDAALVAQATGSIPIAAPGLPSVTPFSDKVGLAILVPWLIEQAKRSNLPFLTWIDPAKIGRLRFLSGFGALLSTVGIAWRYDPEAQTLMITGLTLWSLVQFLYEAVKQFAMQEATYRAAFKEKATGAPTP